MNEVFLARAVAVPHAMQLGNRLVRFINEHDEIALEIIEQRGWRLSRLASGEMARIVFNAVAVTDRLDHLQVKAGALMHAL